MANPSMFTKEELETLRNGGIVDIGGKRYRMCVDCRQIVQLNKKLFGDLHLCTEDACESS